MYNGKSVTVSLVNPVEILGPRKIVIPIEEDNLV
jgi:hypothetical protein